MAFEISNYQLFLNDAPLFKAISARVEAKEVLAIRGKSGSGKSTILSDILGGLAPVFSSRGDFFLNGRNLRPLPIEQRHTGILFQDDLLFPHLNVFENLVFGLPKSMPLSEKRERVADALKEADLVGFEDRDIVTLSGGQRSRIALLRTLLSEPDLVLLDEPFSKLDQELRTQFREWVFDHINALGIPTLLVTHDSDDIPESAHVLTLENIDA